MLRPAAIREPGRRQSLRYAARIRLVWRVLTPITVAAWSTVIVCPQAVQNLESRLLFLVQLRSRGPPGGSGKS